MTTRLDRLLLILDSGTSAVTRNAAAKQLGEVQQLHPHELPNLLARVHVYLKSKNWDTRVAAAQAIEAIASNVPAWNPDGVKECDDEPSCEQQQKLNFEEFDIAVVLEKGEKLLGSAGDEYDAEEEIEGLSDAEMAAFQRKALCKRLGLDLGGDMDLGMGKLIDDADLISRKPKLSTKQSSVESAADVVASQIAAISSDGQMSSRQKNRAIRVAKNLAKQRSRDLERGGSFEEPAEKRQRRTQSVLVEQPSEDKVLIDNVADNASTLDEMEEWPFERFCAELSLDIFNPTWEVRHGASSALREIVKLHGAGAGKSKSTPVTKMIEVNTAWLEDTALKLMCVFALDRFGDFVSDEVVAPVHETCAQTLGSILHHMPEQSVRKVLSILIKLQENEEWQVRRGGLLGLKYMLAVRKDMALELLPQVFPWVLKGLQDGDDDVRAVSAAALLPVAELLGTSFPQQVPSVLGILWDALLELDDLTASTNSVMSLLATLVQVDFCQPPDQQHAGLSELVPRLFPFFRHTISSVRQSALNTLNIILQHSKGAAWIEGILKTLMRELFQRVVIEPLDKIRDAALQIWSLALQHSPAHVLDYCTALYSPVWLRLLVHPPHSFVDPNLLTYDGVHAADKSNGAGCYYYLGSINSSMTATEKDNVVISARIAAASCLGGLLSAMERQQCTNTVHLLSSLQSLLFSTAATQRLCAAFVFHAWSNANKVKMEQNQQSTTVEQQQLATSQQQLISTLQNALQQQIVYDELMLHHQRLQADTQTLVYCFAEHQIDISCAIPMGSFNIDSSSEIATTKFNEESPKLPPKALKTAQAKQSLLLATISTLKTEYMKWHTRVQSCIAASLISFNQLTAKLNPVIRPVMDSIKREDDPRLRKRTAVALAQLLALCVSRQPCPNTKIVKNLCMLACSDTARSPPLVFDDLASATAEESDITCKKTSGIFTLHNRRKMAAKESETRGRGRISRTNSQKDLPATNSTEEIEQSNNETQCEGAVTALTTCVKETADCLPQVLPFLWQTTFQVVSGCTSKCGDEEQMTQLNSSLQILEYIAPHLHPTLKQNLVNILPNLRCCLDYPYTTIRHRASKCFGVLSQVITSQTMDVVLRDVLEMLTQSENETGRQGAIETVINTIEGLGLDVLPYVVLLLGPVLARMSDHLKDVRLLATNCFALLVQLIPLESGVSDPVGLSDDLKSKKLTERRFLEQLLDGKKLDQYTIPIPIDCQLRKYQQDGVNWLAFLKKYSLHGILCDDMGLGKTLQSICIMAADYHNSLKKFKISCKVEHKPLPSLVVCPTTLTGHWCYEVQKFCEKQHLNPLQYIGTPNDRQRLQRCLKDHNLVVSSYDIVRNDADFFLGQHWNYCILDEGHVIKNSKTKLSKTIKLLKAQHRLILSGTPIQNNVIELWSLFDFLMPGYLGTEKEFSAKFARPILQSKDAKSSSKEQEAGAMAMESLHKQTLPFLLRRVKEDVLQDLPPKIIQDYYCELSPLQVKLYEDFSQTKARKNVDGVIGDDKKDVKQGAGHIFQALQYLRKVCNHPSLVISPSHPEYNTICGGGTINLNDIKHSAKLVALRQLLLDCGIGKEEEDEISVVSQHRALIFCQMRSMLNIVENDLLKAHMPNVTYTRLDGSVPANQRHNIVQKFNNDPSIDVLLLTTHIGGLGLNLTGADTVIFVEHDWNPMKDLQAMDRAHRIGQKKVVNVYRLIARSTLEEKIMGLQKFKLNIANTVITKDNSSLYSMDTSQLLDLFTVDKKKEKAERSADNKKVTMKALLEEVGELWDEKQYEEEYDMESFMQSLAK